MAAHCVTQAGIDDVLEFGVIEVPDHLKPFALLMASDTTVALGAEFSGFKEGLAKAQCRRFRGLGADPRYQQQADGNDLFLHGDLPETM